MGHGVPFLRQVWELEDFGPALSDEVREQEERLRAQLAEKSTPIASGAGSVV